MSTTDQFARLWTREAVLDRALEVAGLDRPKDRKNRKGQRARQRLAQFDRLIGSTPHSDPLLTQARHHLARLAEQEARRERRRTRKEIPMPDPFHCPGQVTEEPAEETARHEQAAAARAANGHVPGIPEVVMPYLARFETIFAGPPLSAVLTTEAYRLARVLLDFPPRDQVHILARILFRLGTRGAR